MSTYKIMSQSGFSALHLDSDDHQIQIKLYHHSSGKWEIERSGGTPFLMTSRTLTDEQAKTFLATYDNRNN